MIGGGVSFACKNLKFMMIVIANQRMDPVCWENDDAVMEECKHSVYTEREPSGFSDPFYKRRRSCFHSCFE